MISMTLEELLSLEFRPVASKGDKFFERRYRSLIHDAQIPIGPLVVSKRGYDRYLAGECGAYRLTFSKPDESYESLEYIEVSTHISNKKDGLTRRTKYVRKYRGCYWRWTLNDLELILDDSDYNEKKTQVDGNGE